jgi:hypothetical protein
MSNPAPNRVSPNALEAASTCCLDILAFDKLYKGVKKHQNSHRSAIHLIEYEASDFETFPDPVSGNAAFLLFDQPFHRLASASDVR